MRAVTTAKQQQGWNENQEKTNFRALAFHERVHFSTADIFSGGGRVSQQRRSRSWPSTLLLFFMSDQALELDHDG
jgi:hypothetical protein